MASNRKALTPERVNKECQAAELREAGLDYDTIAEKLGYSDRSGAFRAVQRILKRAQRESGSQLLELELRRLDTMHEGLWLRAQRGDTFSVDRVLKIQERRAKYLNLDPPARVALTDPTGEREYGQLSDTQLEREIAAAVARVRGEAGTPGAGTEVSLDTPRSQGATTAGE